MNPWVLFVVLALAASPAAQDADKGRLESQARRATERLQALYAEADRLARDARSLLGDLRKLELQRQIKGEEFRQADEGAREATAELEKIDVEVRRLEQQEAVERPELEARLVELYKLGQGRYIRLLLSTSDARRLGQASRTVAALARRDRERIVAYQRRLEELTASRKTLAARRQELASVRAAADRARAAAQHAVEERNALIRDLDRRRDLNAQLAGELTSAQQQLQTRLQNLATGAAADAPTLPIKPFRGDLGWPADGALRQHFGRPAGPGRPSSNGVEIAAVEGSPVVAVHDGVVAFSGPFTGYGNLVILDHGSQTFSLYGSLLQATAPQGVRLERGDAIGTVGPSVAGPAGLYFELRVDGRAVDPLQWLKR